MKTFASILMAIVILAGLVLAITPFVADKFFPIPENTVRQAKPEAAANALRQWFNSPDAGFIDVQAINHSSLKTSAQPESGQGQRMVNTAWFAFSVGRNPVEKYIISKKLEQKDLTQKVLEETFFVNQPPASWWQPQALAQQTYFTGEDQGRNVSLIYSPESKRGVLVTTTGN